MIFPKFSQFSKNFPGFSKDFCRNSYKKFFQEYFKISLKFSGFQKFSYILKIKFSIDIFLEFSTFFPEDFPGVFPQVCPSRNLELQFVKENPLCQSNWKISSHFNRTFLASPFFHEFSLPIFNFPRINLLICALEINSLFERKYQENLKPLKDNFYLMGIFINYVTGKSWVFAIWLIGNCMVFCYMGREGSGGGEKGCKKS